MNKIEDIGIYTNIYQTEQRKHGHILYHAKCKVCGMEVYKPLKEIRECHTQCRHGENNGEYARTVYGRGYNSLSKDIPRDEFYKRVYEKWRHMIYRCSDKFQEKYPTYKGTTCSKEWEDFANFYRDVTELQGFEFWIQNPLQMIMLDKDTLVKGNKLYSKETCCFISHADSNRDVAERHPEILKKASQVFAEKASQPVIAINKHTGEEQWFPSLKECCRQLPKVTLRHLWMCLSKEEKYKSHHTSAGYIFRYADEELSDELKQILHKYMERYKKQQKKIK